MTLPSSADSLASYLLVGLCALLALGLAWQAWRGYTGPRRVGRLLAGLLAAAALWFSVYPPQHRVVTPRAPAAILLTDGYSPDSVRVLRRRLGPVPLLRYRPLTLTRGDTLAINSLPSLPIRFPGLQRLHVFGYGLPAADAAALPAHVLLTAHQRTPSAGFTAAEWNQQLPLGEPLRLEGRWQGTGTAPVWVRLRAAGRTVDSARLPAAGGSFALRYQPRYVGRQLLRLEARQARALLVAEPVPVQVRPVRRLRVLLLAGSPSFELNLLKNHLASQGHQVALRLRLSPGLLQTDAQNQPPPDLARLTPATLRRFDAVVADADGLRALPTSEAQSLAAAAAEGLGVLLIGATELPRTLPGHAAFSLQPRSAPQAELPQPIRWAANQATAVLPTVLRATPNVRPLVTGPQAAVVAASYRVGWGSVGVATPASTYQWLLSGATARYASYWHGLLGAVGRPLEPAARWTAPRWPRPDEPQLLLLATPRPPARLQATVSGSGDTTLLPLRQDPAQAELWQATYWPQRAGWHRVVAPRLDTSYFYVFGPKDWLGPLRAQRLRAAGRRIAPPLSATAASATHTEFWLPAGWFVTLFVAAVGGLWLDEKR